VDCCCCCCILLCFYVPVYTHTHPFNGPFSGTTQVSRYQKGRTNLDFTEARDCEWQWHQLGQMQVCTLLQTDNHTSIPPLSFFTGRMPFLSPNQQRQSTEGNLYVSVCVFKFVLPAGVINRNITLCPLPLSLFTMP